MIVSSHRLIERGQEKMQKEKSYNEISNQQKVQRTFNLYSQQSTHLHQSKCLQSTQHHQQQQCSWNSHNQTNKQKHEHTLHFNICLQSTEICFLLHIKKITARTSCYPFTNAMIYRFNFGLERPTFGRTFRQRDLVILKYFLRFSLIRVDNYYFAIYLFFSCLYN